MNLGGWLLWGFVATLVLTTVLAGSQAIRLTRMSLTFMLGTLFTPNRDRAEVLGFFVHLLDGWVFSLLYVAGFHSLGRATWWLGALGGLFHAAFVLTAGMRMLPSMHPRMASELQGPTVVRQLEPPGAFALNYGYQTPAVVVLAHLAFGWVLGAFYPLASG